MRYVGRALLPVGTRLTGRSAHPTLPYSAKKFLAGCLPGKKGTGIDSANDDKSVISEELISAVLARWRLGVEIRLNFRGLWRIDSRRVGKARGK